MKKIITAVGTTELNERLCMIKEYEIMFPDIQYQEGVIEALEKDENIDFLILNSILPGEFTLYEFINKIKKINKFIEIIIILEKENEEIQQFLISKGIFKIFFNNKTDLNEILNSLEEIKENELKEEIKILKKIILNNQTNNNNKNILNKLKKIKNKLNNIINKLKKFINKKNILNKNKYGINNKIKNQTNNRNKIISITGTNNSGKSIFSAILSNLINNKKIIIIDFNIFNSSINTIFQIKRKINKKTTKNKNECKNNKKNIINNNQNHYDKNEYEIMEHFNKNIIKINPKLDLYCFYEELVDKNNLLIIEKYLIILNKLLNIYDLILIDTTAENDDKNIEKILKNSDKIVFLSEPNILQLKKSKILLNKYINIFGIEKNKINIIINKYNKNSIDEKILEKLFMDFEILGNIKYNSEYDFLLNNNIENNIKKLNKKTIIEYKKIINKIIKNNK